MESGVAAIRRAGIRLLLGAAAAALALLACASPASALPAPWRYECEMPEAGVPRTSSTCGARIVDGSAVAPPFAPQTVKDVISAANRIDGRPYVWGGGHLSWTTPGYDCSGAVGYALHGGDLLSTTMVSGQLEGWGDEGLGRWITVYANWHHVYMVVAGLRYDTRDAPTGVSGPRWHREMADPRNFAARHPAGL